MKSVLLHIKNKKTGLEEIVKNKYTTNLSTLKRTELLSKYVNKEIENVNNSPENTKYLRNTIDKTEYLNRLNEAKNAIEHLKRNKTIKNATPEFYRIGIDVNKLFNAPQNNNTPKSLLDFVNGADDDYITIENAIDILMKDEKKEEIVNRESS